MKVKAQCRLGVYFGPLLFIRFQKNSLSHEYVPSRLRGWASSFLGLLIGGCAIPVNLIVSHGVAVLTHRVARVALHRVDAAILHNPHMVGRTVLASIIPVEKDDVAGARLIAVILPQPALLKPRDAQAANFGITPASI